MIRNIPELPLHDEAFIVEFAGGGGACEGIDVAINRNVDVAVNHDLEAVAMHTINHPTTIHYCESVWKVPPIDVLIMLQKLIGAAWFSPDCKHFSKAKGGALIDKRIRGLAYVILKWCKSGYRGRGLVAKLPAWLRVRMVNGRGPACPRVFFLENVGEFKTWGPLIAKRDPGTGRVVKVDGSVAEKGEIVPYAKQHLVPDPKRIGLYFRRFVAELEEVGGDVEWREDRMCDFGAPTIRQRLGLICRFDGKPIVWPEPTHAAPDSDAVKSGQKKPHEIVAKCLEFHLPCPSIFLSNAEAKAIGCRRPLVKSSLLRIAKGVDRHVLKDAEPFILELTHHGNKGFASINEPCKTVTGANRGEKALISPVIAYAQHGGSVRSAKMPAHGISASPKDQNQLISVYLGKLRGSPKDHPAGESVRGPAHTISAGGNHHTLTAVYLAQHNGGFNTTPGHDVRKPASTIASTGSQQQVVAVSLGKYYGTDGDPRMGDPSGAVTCRDRFCLIETVAGIPPFTPELEEKARRVAKFLRDHGVEFEGEFAMVGPYPVVDIGMRMLTPRELYRIQGFPESYVIDRGLLLQKDGTLKEIKLTKTAQVRMVGNSVSPLWAAVLVAANVPEMRLTGPEEPRRRRRSHKMEEMVA